MSDANSGHGQGAWYGGPQGQAGNEEQAGAWHAQPPAEPLAAAPTPAAPVPAPEPDQQPTQQIPAVPHQDAPPAAPAWQQSPQPQPPAPYDRQPQHGRPPQPQYDQYAQQQFPQEPQFRQEPQFPQEQQFPQGQQYAEPAPFAQNARPPFASGPDGEIWASTGAGMPKPRRTKLYVGSGIGAVAIIGLATVLTLNQGGTGATAHTAASATSPKPTPSGFQPTSKTAAGAAEETAEVFLAAWQSGDLTKAASYTDDPAGAQSVLAAYHSGLNLNGLQLTPKSSTAAGLVTFSVAASISSTGTISANSSSVTKTSTSPGSGSASASAGGAAPSSPTSASGTWSYTSHLTAYTKDGGWYVKWDPSLVAPNVSATVHPVALAVTPGAHRVTDADGGNLADSSQSALQTIASLVKQNTKAKQGTAGLEVALEDANGKIVSGSADKLAEPVSTAVVKTTIDPAMEAVATAAVGELPRSSLVVLRPSTGAILAIANSSGSSDIALTGTLAPGSSMKVITTTGLLVDGMLPQGIDTPVGCPLVETVQGVKIHNSTSSANSLAGTEDFEPNNTPFSTDFAQSCNNAFTQWWQKMDDGRLASAATDYYGLNQGWDIGLGSKGTYFSMPLHQSGSELAEELYGQGQIEANPLSMASVAATVDTGQFHQPYLVDGLTDKVGATPIPSSVKTQLYTVMREVVTSGTADAVGFGPGVYGKTGTAEADANKDHYPNGWMIVFDPSKDLAIACVVIDKNFGAITAGPEVNYVLKHS